MLPICGLSSTPSTFTFYANAKAFRLYVSTYLSQYAEWTSSCSFSLSFHALSRPLFRARIRFIWQKKKEGTDHFRLLSAAVSAAVAFQWDYCANTSIRIATAVTIVVTDMNEASGRWRCARVGRNVNVGQQNFNRLQQSSLTVRESTVITTRMIIMAAEGCKRYLTTAADKWPSLIPR